LIQDVQYDAYFDFTIWKTLHETLASVWDIFNRVKVSINNNQEIEATPQLPNNHYQFRHAQATAWKEYVRKIKPNRRASIGNGRLFYYEGAAGSSRPLTPQEEVDYLLYQMCPDQISNGKRSKDQD
jgi:hypothetical protein